MEYNRYWCDSKRVGDKLKVPDLILHQRGTDNNLVVMEFKTYWNIQTREEIKKDIEELKEMTKTKGDYGYKYGFFIVINKGEPAITLYVDGDYSCGEKEEVYL